MGGSMTRTQECALAVIAISMVAIAIAAPFVTLDPSASWRAKAASGLTMLDALITLVKRVLGL
jgi:Na+-transporting NADH:ubiquinone oxidoreductase subunit NqrB